MTRIRSKIFLEIAESQCGFIPDKGTRNAISTLSMLMERAVEVQRDVYLCFIGYSKAFDKVKHSELFGIHVLDQLNIDGKNLRILRNLNGEQDSGCNPHRRGIHRFYLNQKRFETRLCTIPRSVQPI
ncbi:RNA-directed DNA polymerase from mobile element jockey [Elysia marginata]|uniref:RNA-directed DNA polymerase from mobile element jockey n=1 Tax=Elysia marginata TaxID=1093978 RepID=A0AAV4GG88_9GAST|nr:RNA-directed DNA polymerase from mobile element jockey [Elysia marginata]